MSMQPRKHFDLFTGIAVAFVSLAWTLPWLYRGGFAEHDCYTMGASIMQAVWQGTGLHEPMLYFPVSQPLYYILFFQIPGIERMTLEQLIPIMNVMSWLAMSCSAGLLYAIARTAANRGWALAGVAAVITSQTYFEMSTYSHPNSLALLFTLLGLWAGMRGFAQPEGGWRKWAGLGLFGIMFCAAFYMRIDTVFFLPLIFTMIFITAAHKKQALALTGCVAFLVLLSYPLVTRMLFGAQAPTTDASAGGLGQTLRAFVVKSTLIKGTFYYFYAAGAGAFTALAFLVPWLALRKRWPQLIFLLITIGLPMIYFLANPQPSRRFLPVIVAGGISLAMGGARLWCPRRWIYALMAVLLIALNLGSPLFFRALFRVVPRDMSQTIYYRLQDDAFGNHRNRQDYLWWDKNRWEQLMQEMPENALVIGQWIDLAGMYLNTTRQGAIVKTRMIRFDPAGHLFECTIDKKRIFYLEWYAGAPASLIPEQHGPVFILAPLPPDELKRLPTGKQMVAQTEMLRRRPF